MRNKIIIIIIALLAIAAVFFLSRNGKNTVKRELRDFAVEDTASVTKIFMVRKDNQSVTLTREAGRWIVNSNYPVRPDAIENLLKTLNRIRVKSPVSKSMMDNAVKMLATRNTKVEVYRGKKLIKTIYVGGPTMDQMGTFMMLEGSSVPFVVHVPGFVGYLSTRFFVEEDLWKSTALFKYDFNDIASVTVDNMEKPDQSFSIRNLGNNKFSVESPTGLPAPGPLDTVAARFYLSQFERVNFEFHAEGYQQLRKDSLQAAIPYRVLTLEDRAGTRRVVKAWKRYANGKLDVDNNPLVWDDERLWANLDNKEWVVIQYYVFNGLFRNFTDFFKPDR